MRLPASLNLDFYHRLTRREQVLVLAVGGTFFVLANIIALRILVSNFKELNQERARKATAVQVANLFTQDKPKWTRWVKWVQTHQPTLANRNEEGVKLQNQIKAVADKNGVILSAQAFVPAPLNADNRNAAFQPVAFHVDAKGTWKPMVKFMQGLQQPEGFIALDFAKLQTTPDDPNTVWGQFQIARWYAPTAK